MYGESIWLGREVEGRFSDIETLFIRSFPADFEIESDHPPHVYFTIEFVKTLDWDIIRYALNLQKIVTIEVTESVFDKIPPDLFNRCHLIYRIANEHVAKLKKTDTLSIDAGWYRVHQITKCHLMEIEPDSYKHDRKLYD